MSASSRRVIYILISAVDLRRKRYNTRRENAHLKDFVGCLFRPGLLRGSMDGFWITLGSGEFVRIVAL
jgi:hypothetical protein